MIALTATAKGPLVPASGFQAVAFPVEASRAAMALRFAPAILLKLPPTYTEFPDIARAPTLRSAAGFQAVSAPEAASIAAIRKRVCVPTFRKLPPTYTVPLDTAKAAGPWIAPGYQVVAAPVVASTAAIPLLPATPPIWLNAPATYSVLPESASAVTEEL